MQEVDNSKYDDSTFWHELYGENQEHFDYKSGESIRLDEASYHLQIMMKPHTLMTKSGEENITISNGNEFMANQATKFTKIKFLMFLATEEHI